MIGSGAFAWERVTGFEPALSAWELVTSERTCKLTCVTAVSRVTVRDRVSPWLIAR
jgi:hypothetical protein